MPEQKHFFRWLDSLQKDLITILNEDNRDTIKRTITDALGSVPVSRNLELIIPTKVIQNPPRIHIFKLTPAVERLE